jgi:hypothetical protein
MKESKTTKFEAIMDEMLSEIKLSKGQRVGVAILNVVVSACQMMAATDDEDRKVKQESATRQVLHLNKVLDEVLP